MLLAALSNCILFIFATRIAPTLACEQNRCAKLDEDAINVHMVSHSHDDVGWVKTVNQYYKQQVENILDTVVTALLEKPHRKFIQVESAFFYIWWMQQSKQRKDQVRYLIRNGQLDIVGGAWSMNDEAAAHYQSIIDGFTLGLRFVNDTLGPCAAPKIGWQIDPFGHSRQMASLFAEFGYKALFFARLDYRDQALRNTSRTLEMIWRGNLALGNDSDIFTSVMYNHYMPPEGFCFDNVCGYRIGAYNEVEKVQDFVTYIEEMASAYRTNNILIPMGGDFTYTFAEVYFSQIDYLIDAIRRRKSLTPRTNRTINIFYSTPECYYNAVTAELSVSELEVKTDDFFPYADRPNAHWTGYFTSRPTSKRYEREGNNLLQASKQLAVMSRVGNNHDLFALSNAMGIMQHHDAITGTEQQHVANDYARLLHDGMQQAIAANGRRIETLFDVPWNSEFHTCTLANMSICSAGSLRRFAIVLYNPLGYSISHYVRMPVAHTRYSIKKSIRESVPYQLSTPLRDYGSTTSGDSLPYELIFLAEDIPPLGVRYFLVTVDERASVPVLHAVDMGINAENIELGTDKLGMTVDGNCNMLNVFDNEMSIEFKQELMAYDSNIYVWTPAHGRPSGAYIFSPRAPASDFSSKTCSIVRGPLFDEIRVEYSTWVGQIVRIYKHKKKYIEFDWVVGKIQETMFGMDVISRFKTSINNGESFRTDTNGRSYITRQRNYQPTYDVHHPLEEAPYISNNYYPLTAYIGIEDPDSNRFLTVFTDRAQGGTSLASGEIEIMLHRRMKVDDSLGVGEVLSENSLFMGAVARGQHIIDFGSLNQRDDETVAREMLLRPWPFNIPVDENNLNIWKVVGNTYYGLTRELPRDIHLLTLEPWRKWEHKILIRFEHINQDGVPVLLDANNLFTSFKIITMKETMLAANEWKDERIMRSRTRKYPWMMHKFQRYQTELLDNFIYMRPGHIRTFVATIEYY